MAAVHPSNSSNNNNDTASSSSNRRNGTASPGGWHFPKSGLGTPDLFYSFSGGSSSNGNSHQPAPPSSSHQQQQQQPAWFKPQGGSSSGSNTVAAPGQASSSNQVKADQAMAGPSASSSSIIKKEEPDDGDDDDAKEQAASHQSGFQSKFSRDNEEGTCKLFYVCTWYSLLTGYSILFAFSHLPTLHSQWRRKIRTPRFFSLLSGHAAYDRRRRPWHLPTIRMAAYSSTTFDLCFGAFSASVVHSQPIEPIELYRTLQSDNHQLGYSHQPDQAVVADLVLTRLI